MHQSKLSPQEQLLEKFLQHWDRKMQKGMVEPILVYDRRMIEAYTDWLMINYIITPKASTIKKVDVK